MDTVDEQPPIREQPTRTLLARALKFARGSLLWERLWPALATLATAVGLFLAFSWSGLWVVLPPLARAFGLLIFLALTAVAAVPLVRLRLPSIDDGLRRLDRSSGESTGRRQPSPTRSPPIRTIRWRRHCGARTSNAR